MNKEVSDKVLQMYHDGYTVAEIAEQTSYTWNHVYNHIRLQGGESMMDEILKRMRENGHKVVFVAKELGISRQAFYQKISGKLSMTPKEIRWIARKAGLKVSEIKHIIGENK